MMRTKLFRRIGALLIVTVILLSIGCIGASSAVSSEMSSEESLYSNLETHYCVWIIDDQDLLTDSQEQALLEEMIPITQYGSVIFWSTDHPCYDEVSQAKEKRYEICRYDSSCILAINTDKRKVTFQSDGLINTLVNASYARTITDNASGRASSGDYYGCASEVFSETLSLLQGERIAEPMKYISLIVIGLMLAFVLVVGIAFGRHFNTLIKKNKDKAILKGEGKLFVDMPSAYRVGSEHRGWVVAGQIGLNFLFEVILSGIFGGGGGGGHSGGGGGGFSGGGGSGGSSSY